ncbi:MAG: four helix bundle protein [Candidatus Brocadiia bacterium]
MDKRDLKERTKQFALRILNLVDAIPLTVKGRVVSQQLADAGTSVGANYRAACRARSKSEFIAKLGTVIEEADESAFWLELIMEGRLLRRERVAPLWQEAEEIVAIMVQSRKTAENRLKAPKA